MCPEVELSLWMWIPGISPGIKAAGEFGWRPTTLVVPKRQYNPVPWPTRNPLGHLGLSRVTFSFTLRTLTVLLIPNILFPFLYVWLRSYDFCYNILIFPLYYFYIQASFVELAFHFRSFRLAFLCLNNVSPSSAHTNVNSSIPLHYVTNYVVLLSSIHSLTTYLHIWKLVIRFGHLLTSEYSIVSIHYTTTALH